MESKRNRLKVWQCVLLFAFMFPVLGFAQTIQVKGTVVDGSGMSVIGASVLEKGTTNGVITDIDGNFELAVSPKGTLQISYVGFQTQEIPVNNQTTFKVTLKEDTEMLDEVIVVGYGVMKKSDMTGAISSVDTEELVKRTTTNPAEALQGKIAGVNIMKAGGNAGAGVSVKIRGVKSFGDNEPLYIIDGFPGDINNVNPVDIQSMEVLKDGAAAAIYGSVAANGVVIITTKNGKKGDLKVDFNTYISFTKVAKQLDLLNAAEYKQVHKQMYDNYNAYATNPVALPAFITHDTGVDTNWQDAMTRHGLSQNYMVSVRGGSEKAQYSVSYNHADDKGIFLGNNYTQDNARMKLHVSKYIFDIDANLNFKYTNSQQPEYSLREVYGISPLLPIYDSSNEYGFGLTNFDGLPNSRNVMADYFYEKSSEKNYYTNGNIALTMNFTDWLSFKTSYSYRGIHTRESYHAPAYIADEKSPNEYPYNSETNTYWEEQVFDNVLNFNKEFDKHSLNVMAGSSITARESTWSSVSVEGSTTTYSVENGQLVTNKVPAGFLNQAFETIGAGAGGTFSGDGTKWEYNRASFFGRVNYNFNDRYLVQATVRWDGSSKFGADSRWGFFPSVAVGWRISQEEFFPKDSFVDNLKLRASWGQLGNENALDYYDFLALVSTYNEMYQGYVKGSGNNPWPGSIARGLENRSLQWETTDSKNVGVDFSMFNSRLSGSINYYHSVTRDLLITRTLAPSAGLDDPTLNVGKMRNNGIEIELNWSDKVKDFDYSIGFNLTTTKNKVLELATEGQVIRGEGLKLGMEHFPTETRVGKPIGAFYLYRTDGIFQSMDEVNAHNKDGVLIQPDAKPGDIRFKDLNGNGVIDEGDREYCGSGIPAIEANLSFSAGYKGFDFSVLLGSAWNYKLYNGNKYLYEGMNADGNMLKSTLNAWTETNKNTDVPRAVLQDPNGNMRESDRFLENGNFVRLRQLQLGYTLPTNLMKKIFVEKLRFYVSGENLFTITGYDGIDPEFSRSNVLNTGIDNLIYPFTRSFTVGAQLTF